MALRPPRHGFSVARRLSERARAQRSADPIEPTIDVAGVGGIMEALKSMVEKLADVAKAGSEESAEQRFAMGGKNASMVFGYTLRMGEDGVSAERFGDVPDATPKTGQRSASQPASQPASRQPITDIFEESDAIIVVAELPGADPDGIRCSLDGLSLLIEAGGSRAYRKTLVLPVPVTQASLKTSFQNGILEVRLARSPNA
jgi:HSP20 family protein